MAFDFGELEGKDIALLRKAYAIVNVLDSREPQAGFAENLNAVEGTSTFNGIVENAAADGFSAAEFVAIHALAHTAIQLKDFAPDDHTNELTEFLYATANDLLGSEITGHVREWADASHRDGAALAQSGPWAKLGAMSRSLNYLSQSARAGEAYIASNADAMLRAASSHREIAEACKGLGAGLDSYYQDRLDRFECLVRTAQPPAAPSAGAPGLR